MYYPNYSSEGALYTDEQVNSERAVISLKAHSSEVSALGFKSRADHGCASPTSEVSDMLSGRMPLLEVKVENSELHFLSLNGSLLGASRVCGPGTAGTAQDGSVCGKVVAWPLPLPLTLEAAQTFIPGHQPRGWTSRDSHGIGS